MDNFTFIKLKENNCKFYDLNTLAASSFNKLDFHMFYLNIRSIKKHFDEFKICLLSILEQVEVDIFALTEVNIKEGDIFCYEIEGFKSFKKLRSNKRGGGIVLYVNKKIDFNVVNHSTVSFESIVGITTIQNVEYSILTCYRPPNSSKNIFLNELERTFNVMNSKNAIIIGDTNINIKDKLDINVIKYTNLFTINGYDELIKCYTREEIIKDKLVQSCLDHIYCRAKNNNAEGIVIKNKISDHYIIGIIITNSVYSNKKYNLD